MELRRCEVVVLTRDDVPYTFIVYGPTPGEFAEMHAPGSWWQGHGTVMEIRRVQEKWREDCDRPRRAWWEREARTNHFFTKDLKREGVVGGAGANGQRPSQLDGGQEGIRQGALDEGRSGANDGAEA